MIGRMVVHCMHGTRPGHQPDWDAAEVVEMKPHYWKRRVLEAIWIQEIPQTCDLDCGLTVNESWATHIQ